MERVLAARTICGNKRCCWPDTTKRMKNGDDKAFAQSSIELRSVSRRRNCHW